MEKKEVKQQQHQSESITFRLDSTILNKLHREAEQKDISVNTLVSHIIRAGLLFHQILLHFCYCMHQSSVE